MSSLQLLDSTRTVVTTGSVGIIVLLRVGATTHLLFCFLFCIYYAHADDSGCFHNELDLLLFAVILARGLVRMGSVAIVGSARGRCAWSLRTHFMTSIFAILFVFTIAAITIMAIITSLVIATHFRCHLSPHRCQGYSLLY